MTSLVEIARAALSANEIATASYHFSTAGLKPDKAILAHVKEVLNNRPEATEETDKALLTLVRSGVPLFKAARSLKLDPDAIDRRLQLDVSFASQMRVAKKESAEPVEEVLRQRALDDQDKWAIQMILEAKNRDEYGEPDKNVNVNINHIVDDGGDPIIARIAQLKADLIAAKQAKALTQGSIIDVEYEDTEEL